MSLGTVSVIVPVYNAEKYLDSCVESIAAQTYTQLEIILVDDGSVDNSPVICDAWAEKDPRVRVIHKENAGAGLARNAGMDIAAGGAMCFVDSDDYISPDLVEKAVAALEKHDADVIIYGISNVSASGEMIRRGIPEAPRRVYSGNEVTEELLPGIIYNNKKGSGIRNILLSLCNCVITSETVNRAGLRLRSEREIFSEDSCGIMTLYRHIRRAVVLNEDLYFYRENDTSLSHNYRMQRFDLIKVFYHEACALVSVYENREELTWRVCCLYLSFVIASMKQIVLSAMPLTEKLGFFRRIILDPVTRETLDKVGMGDAGRARNILYYIMKKGSCTLAYVLVKLQTARRR